MAIAAWQMQALAQASVPRIVDSLAAGVPIAVFAALIARFSSKQSSSTKFALWFGALMGVAAAPVLSGLSHWGAKASIHAISEAAITLPSSFAEYIFACWGVVAMLLLVKIIVGVHRLRELRESFVPVDLGQLGAQVIETLHRCQAQRKFSFCISEKVEVPAAIGLFDPVVVVPGWLVRELSAEEQRQILLHEFAHLRRRDDWTNLVQQVVKALFFFHPAVWWIEKNVSLEREMACDDAVLSEIDSARSYAECLQSLAEKSFVRRRLAFVHAALGRVGQISMRVARILSSSRPAEKAPGWRIALPLAGIVIACSLFAAREPQLIAFQDPAPLPAVSTDARSSTVPIKLASFKTRDEFRSENPATRDSISSSRISAKKPVVRTVIHRQVARSTATFAMAAFDGSAIPARPAQASASLEPGAVFILIEDLSSNDSGIGIYRIQLWRMTVWRPAAAVTHQISRKEI